MGPPTQTPWQIFSLIVRCRGGLEQIFNVESLEVPDREVFSSYDQEQIERFQNSITLKDMSYYVQLPWHADNLAHVPSNHVITLHTLERVVWSLEKRGCTEFTWKCSSNKKKNRSLRIYSCSHGILGIISGYPIDLSLKVTQLFFRTNNYVL